MPAFPAVMIAPRPIPAGGRVSLLAVPFAVVGAFCSDPGAWRGALRLT